MKVRRAIPASLTVAGKRIETHYREQGLSCWKCGRAHKKADCNTEFRDYVNRFRFEDFNQNIAQSDNDTESITDPIESNNTI